MWWHWTVWVDWVELDTTGFLCFTLASSTAATPRTKESWVITTESISRFTLCISPTLSTGFLCIWHVGNSLKDTAQKFCCKDMYLGNGILLRQLGFSTFQHFLKLLFFSETVFISLFIMIYHTEIMRIHETVSSSLNISLTVNFQHKQTKLIHDGLWKC